MLVLLSKTELVAKITAMSTMATMMIMQRKTRNMMMMFKSQLAVVQEFRLEGKTMVIQF